jgi:microtubule-associated protein-like 1/2
MSVLSFVSAFLFVHHPCNSDSIAEDSSIKLYLRGHPVVLYAPTGVDISEADQALPPPQQKLHLEWVYGYRGKDCRSNLFVLPSGEVLYFIAAVAVVYNPETGTQTHFTGHNDDIKSLALHPNMKIVATGQVASLDKETGKPHVLVWDVETLETKAVIGLGEFERSVSSLAFSLDGETLLAVDESNEHMMSIWDWKKKRKLQETRTHSDPVLGAIFHPTSENLAIVSYGKQHVYFWSAGDDGKLQKKMGLFEKHAKPKYITSAIFSENGDLITGDSNGSLFHWDSSDHKIKQEVKAHEGAVFGLTYLHDGSLLSGGGKDRKLVLWDKALARMGKEQEVTRVNGLIRHTSN